MPGFSEEKKKGRVCLCKERHLLPDKTATSAKGLLSPLINLTPLDSEITISTTRADLQGQDFTRSNPFVKCHRRYLWLLLWGRWFLRTTPFALSQSGFIAGATVPHTLRNPLLPWPLTSMHWYSENRTIFDIYIHVPFSSHFFSSLYPSFHPRETSTNKISPRVCSFECHTSHHYAIF